MPLTTSSLKTIADNAACENPQTMEGDPDYWGTAAGLYCLPDSGTGIVVRVYDQDDATAKVIENWADLITEDNQIAYGDNWFATGPAPTLLAVLEGFTITGPQPTAPKAKHTTAAEADLAMCSSITYGVLSQTLISGTSSDLQQYYDSYPGMQQLAAAISEEAINDGARSLTDDDLLLTARLTNYDSQVKNFCHQALHPSAPPT